MTWLAYSHLGVPKAVQLTTQPAGALAGIAFTVQPVGRLIDGGGVLSRTTGATVTSSKAGGVGTLSGTLSVQTAEGVFTFTDLRMDTVTSAVTLLFASSGLTSATSNQFNVTQPNTTMGAETGVYVTTGVDAALSRTRVCQCTPGSYLYTGTNTGLDWSGGATLTDDGIWISTYEPVDANTLMADDFSRGAWYTKNYDDAANSGGFGQVGVHGWGGNIYDPITPAGAVEGGFVGLHGREFAATSGYLDGTIGGHNMAEHGFVNNAHYNEVYYRMYFRRQSDYIGGHEKMFDLTRGFGTGQMVELVYNYFGTGRIRGIPYLHQDDGVLSQPGNGWFSSNQATELVCTTGRWYYIEMHVVLNTPGVYNGIWEMWMDDCGPNGTTGPATPTLRSRYTDVLWRGSGESAVDLGGIWIENWANAPTTGTTLYANVYCSTHFIGFANPAHQP